MAITTVDVVFTDLMEVPGAGLHMIIKQGHINVVVMPMGRMDQFSIAEVIIRIKVFMPVATR